MNFSKEQRQRKYPVAVEKNREKCISFQVEHVIFRGHRKIYPCRPRLTYQGWLFHLFIIRRHLILDIPDERDSHLCRIVAAKHITHEVSLDLHLHLESGPSAGNSDRSHRGEYSPSPVTL